MTVVSGHLEAPELAEREREVATLASSLAEATAGRGGMAVVTGKARAGKTALLQGFCAGRSSEAVRVLWGRCAAILRKLGACTRGEAVAAADRLGLLETR